ncbi:hypothetical protein FDUTEX481_01528 [Tolypothrix sp. PCC 7601]|nr:hypothetical protein FDUTEX481_01528 [Tolypothrix sp. PCC 7601]
MELGTPTPCYKPLKLVGMSNEVAYSSNTAVRTLEVSKKSRLS